MSKELSVILLGTAVVVIPNLGVPSMWRTLLLVLVGFALVMIGLLMRSPRAHAGRNSHHPFVEHDAAQLAHDHSLHEHKERISSLN